MQTYHLLRFYRSRTCERRAGWGELHLCAQAPQLCGRRGAVIHHEQSLINTGEEKMLCKQRFLCFSLQWSSVGLPAAADEMKIDFPLG